MKIAILGATSLIAKDFILALTKDPNIYLSLFARQPQRVLEWLKQNGKSINIETADFEQFTNDKDFDAVINFVGAGDPVQIAKMGAEILNVSFEYDSMVLSYLQNHPSCKYIFLSSGAAYGDSFLSPVDYNSTASISINRLSPQDWYGIAKLHAECRHRAHPHFTITDIRIFNYISPTQDLSSRSLITDIFRSIRDKEILMTNPETIVRDFLHADD
ncbi:MAG: NAD-dependent epimerase/dehydratase family protein, partial [Crocinitomicaceae bacterium]|nr:NAD-dependent epimerase/dehydratase family protein [Crocinitomicaceae bacterium]